MNWILFWEALYLVILIMVCLRIIMDTRSTTKTLAYLLFVIFIPIAGIIFYLFFGINYRKKKMYRKKLFQNEDTTEKVKLILYKYSKQIFYENDAVIQKNKELAYMLIKDTNSHTHKI